MSRLILAIHDYLASHKGVAWSILAVVIALSVLSLSRLRYSEDISAFLPSDPDTEKYERVYKALGSERKIAIFFEAPTQDAAISAMDDFGSLWQSEAPMDINVTVDEVDVFGVFDFINENYPRFLTEADYRRIDSLLADPGYIDRQIALDKEEMYSTLGGLPLRRLRSDPLNLFPAVLQRLQDLNPASGATIVDGHLFTADGSAGAIIFDSPFEENESALNAPLAEHVSSVIAETSERHPDVKIYATGVPLISVQNSKCIKRDSALAIAIALILISLVLWFSFKRGADVLWIAISIATGVLFALGLIALFKSEISIIILGIGSIIIGIAVNYPLHYVDHFKYRGNRRTALSEQINPLLVGNITTVGAFLSMMMLRSGALRDFGFIAAMTLVGTILFVLFFLPVFVPDAKAPRKTLKLDFDRFFHPSKGWRRAIFAAFVIISALMIPLSRKVSFDADMHNINYITPEQDAAFETLERLTGGTEGCQTEYLVSEGGSMDEALQRSIAAEATLPPDCSVSSITAFLPPMDIQQERSAAWTSFVAAHPSLRTDIMAAAILNGFSPAAFSPFLDMLSETFEPKEPEFFALVTEPLGKAMLSNNRVVSYVSVPEGKALEIKAAIRENLPEGSFCFDADDISLKLVGLLNDDFDHIGLICSLIVFFFLTLSFGRLELSIISFLPLAFSWWWILGMMHLTGLQFNIVNIILATFIFGQGDDYTIFITEGLMYERSTGRKILPSYKNCVMLSALIMFIGIGSLIVARHPAMRSLGEVTVIGMFTVVLMAYYLPPLLFRFLTEKKGFQRRVPVTLGSFLRTVLMSVIFLVAMIFISLHTLVHFLFGGSRDKYHRFVRWYCSAALKLIPGVRFSWTNPHGEDFSKPAVFVCNHQSHLDVLALLQLTPKLVILTNEWVWNNPFYGYIIRKAEFYPISNGLEGNIDRLRSLVERGYSVAIFPEGTRSADCSIGRFHRGPFMIARELGIDILPCYIHGFGYALPKLEFNLSRADLSLEVGQRIACSDIPADLKVFTRSLRSSFISEYGRIRRERETARYLLPLVRAQYIYKGTGAERASRLTDAQLSEIDAFRGDSVSLEDNGYGAYALLLSLVHPETTVTCRIAEEENYLIATLCPAVPSNLKYIQG